MCHSPFYDWLHYLLLFGLGGAAKTAAEEEHRLSHFNNTLSWKKSQHFPNQLSHGTEFPESAGIKDAKISNKSFNG